MRQWRNELFVKREWNRLVARQRQRLTRLMCVSVFVEHKQSTGCHLPHTRTRLEYTHCVRRTCGAHMNYYCSCSHVNIAFVFASPPRHSNTHSTAAQTPARIHRLWTYVRHLAKWTRLYIRCVHMDVDLPECMHAQMLIRVCALPPNSDLYRFMELWKQKWKW